MAVLFAIVSLIVSFVGIKAGKDDVDMSAVGAVG